MQYSAWVHELALGGSACGKFWKYVGQLKYVLQFSLSGTRSFNLLLLFNRLYISVRRIIIPHLTLAVTQIIVHATTHKRAVVSQQVCIRLHVAYMY